METLRQYPSGSPVFIKLPAEAPVPTDRGGGSRGTWSSFSWKHNGPFVPLQATSNHKHLESGKSSIEPEAGSRATSPSIESCSSQEDRLATFEANIQQSYHRKIPTSQSFLTVKQQKSRVWYDALMMKRDAAEGMLRAQKIIQEIEDEIAECLTEETIARLRSRFYKIEDESTADGRFISTISNVLVER